MREQPYIETEGLVTECTGNRATVLLTGHAACSGCSTSLCMLADAKSRYVEVHNAVSSLQAGDAVTVSVKPSSAYRATLWLYGVPFVLMVAVLFSLTGLGLPEPTAGVASLGFLIPYYAGLHLVRKKFGKPCTVEVVRR